MYKRQGTDVTFKASETITLKDGFHAKANATFLARIENCVAIIETEIEARSIEAEWVPEAVEMELSLQPNPSKYITSIQFQLPEAGNVFLEVYNSTGQLVKSIANNDWYDSGTHSKELIVGDYQKGMYFVNLRTANDMLTKKLIVLE